MDLGTALQATGALKQRTAINTNDYLAFGGGLDVMDSPMTTPPGSLLGCLNYEPGVRGGYRRCDGYERMDGHPSPTDTPYVAIGVTPQYNVPVGTLVTESGSGATGVVAYIDDVNWYVVLTLTTGAFTGEGSTLTSTSGNTVTTSIPYINGAIDNTTAASYSHQKYIYLQSFIGPVGGSACSGPVRGAYPYKDTVYAFRDTAAGTAGTMWKSTSTGWQQVQLGRKVRFNAGVYSAEMAAPLEGTVLTGATSAATMTIKRIVLQTGTWGTDAAGYFIVSDITGAPVAGEALQNSGTTYMTYLSDAAQTLPAGGFYEFRTFNFNASQDPDSGFRLYGINAVGNAFEYDSQADTFVLIETGMSPDIPTHLEVHASSYLFLSFAGGSLQNSGYQLPLVWNAVFGADSRQVGEDVTFMREDVSGSLVVGTRRRIWMVTGIIVEQFQVLPYAPNNGALPNTCEIPGQMVFMEDRGFTTLAATVKYGNFEASSLSDKILKIVSPLIDTDPAVGATVSRKKNLYRVMFASGTMFCLGINAQGKFSGWTTVSLPTQVNGFYCGYSQGTQEQIERSFVTAANGYVYEVDKGNSFDGASIQHFLRLSYYASKNPNLFKRYRRIQTDLSPEGPCSLVMSVDYDNGNRSGQVNEPLDFIGNGGYWDVALWDQFNWDAPQYAQAAMKVEGEGYNIGLFFAGSSNTDSSVTLYGAALQWTPRIINRNTGAN